MKTSSPSTVTIDEGEAAFKVCVGSSLSVVIDGKRIPTQVTRILGSEKAGYYIQVAHEGMRFNCKDGWRRGYPPGYAYVERIKMPTIEGMPVPQPPMTREGVFLYPPELQATPGEPRTISKVKLPEDPAEQARTEREAKLRALPWDKIAADPGVSEIILDLAEAHRDGEWISRQGDAWNWTVKVEHADPGR